MVSTRLSIADKRAPLRLNGYEYRDMARLTRAESMERTRRNLIDAALVLYRHLGYSSVSIERIVEHCELSRGAFYAHFNSKEAIYLEIIREKSQDLLNELLSLIEETTSRDGVIDLLCDWADRKLLEDELGYLFIEILHQAKKTHSLTANELVPVRYGWQQIGAALSRFFPEGKLPGSAEEIGAIVLLQLADGPFVEQAGGPTTSRLLRITLNAFFK